MPDRREYYRAYRWKQEPLQERIIRTGRHHNGSKTIHLVKPVSREMRQWITDQDITDAEQKAISMNR